MKPAQSDFFQTKSPKLSELIGVAKKIANTSATVLITGESGTGKSYLAKVIHENSSRKSKDFYTINCAALSEQLLESELFGHVKGSFTGALSDKVGKLQSAEGGTIFLDEIGETSLRFQAALLRFLQDKEFERVGAVKTIKVDVRIIAATNKKLEILVKEKEFREDLFYRLNVINLKMPPVRERVEDIPSLAIGFLKDYQALLGKTDITVGQDFMDVLKKYSWPGNIREIKNAMERVAILSTDKAEISSLPEEVVSPSAAEPGGLVNDSQGSSLIGKELSLQEIERLHIEEILKKTDNFNSAAEILGINCSTLWRKRKAYQSGSFQLSGNSG